MRILHGKGFSQSERARVVETILHSIRSQMQVLLDTAAELGITLGDSSLVEEFKELPVDQASMPKLGSLVQSLWADAGVRETYAQRSKFQMNDSAA